MVMLSPSPHPQLTVFDNGQQNLAARQSSWRYKVPTRFVRVGGQVDDANPLCCPLRLPREGTHPTAESDAGSYPNLRSSGLISACAISCPNSNPTNTGRQHGKELGKLLGGHRGTE